MSGVDSPGLILGLLAACRWLQIGILMVVFGAAWYRSATPYPLKSVLTPGRFSSALFAWTLGLACLTWLPLQTAMMNESWDQVTPAMLLTVLLHTETGWTGLITILLGCLTAGGLARQALLAPPRRQAIAPDSREAALPAATLVPGQASLALLSGACLASAGLAGHAAMRDGWAGALERINQSVHLLMAGAWIGGLVVFIGCLRALDFPALRGHAVASLRRASKVGHGVVAAVLLTGSLNVAAILGRIPSDWSSPYQQLLIAKIMVTIGMVLLAGVNRYRILPRMHFDPDATVKAIRRRAIAEIALGMVALALVSCFSLFDPS